jgi:hypothetical protein
VPDIRHQVIWFLVGDSGVEAVEGAGVDFGEDMVEGGGLYIHRMHHIFEHHPIIHKK